MNKNWLQFQNVIDIYKPMRFEIEKRYNAKHVTNAWLKYWELYFRFGVVPEKTDHKYVAFFNAELPGAALCAFNHYMKTMRGEMEFDWRASSLAPSNSVSALGDTYGLYEKNRDKWLMTIGEVDGRKNNGDSTIVANLLDFVAQVGPESPFGGVDLYSHDAGIDVSTDDKGGLGFNNQELANARVHFGCALAGLLTLRKGGAFIAKQYTMFETFTWNLILIYAQLFDEFYISKPLTSRPYNSEIYLVGKGYRGLSEPLKGILMTRLENFNTQPLIEPGAKEVLGEPISRIIHFARAIYGQQIAAINENVELFEKYRSRLWMLKNALDDLKAERSGAWYKDYPLKTIRTADQLPSK